MGPAGSKATGKGTQSAGSDLGGSFSMDEPDLHRPRQGSPNSSTSEYSTESVEKYRWTELMQSLQKLSRLHHQGATESVLERQKRLEVAFKRTDVWKSDAKFMSEIQRLEAEGILDSFKELSRLGKECQIARDTLGPLEDEIALMDQKWESQKFQLKKAEEDVYTEFQAEFDKAKNYPPGSESEPSTNSAGSFYYEADEYDDERVYSETEVVDSNVGFIRQPVASRTPSSSFPPQVLSSHPILDNLEPTASQDTMLLGVDQRFQNQSEEQKFGEKDTGGNHSREGSADTDNLALGLGTDQDVILNQYSEMVNLETTSSRNLIQLFKQSKTRTASDRISSWLLEILLLSRIQATILKEHVDTTNPQKSPSNWAQLVLALWNFDGSATDIEKKAQEASLYNSSSEVSSHRNPSRSSEPILSHNSNQATVGSLQQNYTYVSNQDGLPGERRPILPRRPAPRRPLRSPLVGLQKSSQGPNEESEPP